MERSVKMERNSRKNENTQWPIDKCAGKRRKQCHKKWIKRIPKSNIQRWFL